MGNRESHICFGKINKSQLFFDKNWPETLFRQKLLQYAAQWNSVPTTNAKMLGIQPILWRQDSKMYILPFVKSENWKVSLITRRKKNWAAESLEYDRPWTHRRVYTKIRWIRPKGAEKIRFKQLKRRRMSWTGRETKSFWRLLVQKDCAPLA